MEKGTGGRKSRRKERNRVSATSRLFPLWKASHNATAGAKEVERQEVGRGKMGEGKSDQRQPGQRQQRRAACHSMQGQEQVPGWRKESKTAIERIDDKCKMEN